MISHQKKFIFTHIPRTGGTSVEFVIEKYVEYHKRHNERIRFIPRKYVKEYTNFSIIRNPWDRIVSIYEYGLQIHKGKYPIWCDMPFQEWVKNGLKVNKRARVMKQIWSQLDWICDKRGNILVDNLFRFEDLNNEWKKIKKLLSINDDLPYLNSTKRDNYKSYYDDESIKVIEKLCKDDIKHFGYKF